MYLVEVGCSWCHWHVLDLAINFEPKSGTFEDAYKNADLNIKRLTSFFAEPLVPLPLMASSAPPPPFPPVPFALLPAPAASSRIACTTSMTGPSLPSFTIQEMSEGTWVPKCMDMLERLEILNRKGRKWRGWTSGTIKQGFPTWYYNLFGISIGVGE